MASAITDLLKRVTDSTTGRPVIASLAAPKAIGASSVTINDATNWTTTTAVDFSIYEVTAAGIKDTTTQTDWKATLSGTTLSSLTITGGTDRAYSTGAKVEITPTSRWAKDLYDWGITHANQDGSLKTTAVQAALNISGSAPADWTALATVPSLSASNGQREFSLVYAGVDYTDRLQKGTKLRIPRTVTAPTQSTLLNGTNQYWSKTSPAGMTFTDDFVAAGWGKASAIGTKMVINSRYNGTSGWELFIDTTGQVVLRGYNGGSANYSEVRSYQSIATTRFSHVAGQLDMSAFTATTTTSYIMIDGVDVPCSVARAGTNPVALTQAGDYQVGESNAASFYNGTLAQVFVASAKITQATIKQLYNQGLTSALITANNIVSAHSFSGNANDINTTTANNLTAMNSAVATNADSPFSATEFGIVTGLSYSGGNTTVTVFTGPYLIPNETLGTTSYSTARAPLGFDADKGKWKVDMILKVQVSQTGVSTNTVYNIAGLQLTVPTGAWNLSYAVLSQITGTSAGFLSSIASLSTSNNSVSDAELSSYAVSISSASAETDAMQSRSKAISTTAATPYYLVQYTQNGTTSMALYWNGAVATGKIIAECAYL